MQPFLHSNVQSIGRTPKHLGGHSPKQSVLIKSPVHIVGINNEFAVDWNTYCQTLEII